MSNSCCSDECRNLLLERDKYYCRFAESVYNEFRRLKYGIASCTKMDDLMIDAIRKDIVDYQANSDGGPAYIYRQACNESLSMWTITHNLGYAPSVWTINCDGQTITGTITITDCNILSITFTFPQSGIAYLT